MSRFFWSDDADATLRRLWAAGAQSAGEIAAQMGTTRSSVLSRIRRLNLSVRAADDSPAAKFERLIDLVADAPINNPVSIARAAQRVRMPVAAARNAWARLCASLGPQATPGEQYRVIR